MSWCTRISAATAYTHGLGAVLSSYSQRQMISEPLHWNLWPQKHQKIGGGGWCMAPSLFSAVAPLSCAAGTKILLPHILTPFRTALFPGCLLATGPTADLALSHVVYAKYNHHFSSRLTYTLYLRHPALNFSTQSYKRFTTSIHPSLHPGQDAMQHSYLPML